MARSRVPDAADADVIVVGGGPAGAVCAGRLAASGADVVLVDRARPSRRVVPRLQSLSADAVRLLASEGIDDQTAMGARIARSSQVRWADTAVSRSDDPQLIVDRDSFDATLLAWALRGSATLERGRVVRVEEGPHPVVEVESDGRRKRLSARAVVIAVGRAGLHGDAPRRRLGPATLALGAHVQMTAEADVTVEALSDGWLWAVALPDAQHVVSIVTDPVPARDAAATFDRLLASSLLLRPRGSGPPRRGPAQVEDATISAASIAEPPSHVHRVGDAVLAADPLSGQGVALALRSGVQTADALITGGVDQERLALPRIQSETVEHHRASMAQFHAQVPFDRPFWAARTPPRP